MCILILSAAQGHCFFWVCCQRPCWIPPGCLAEERFELCTIVHFPFGQDFLSRKGGVSRVVICWFSKAVSSLNLHLLGRIPDWYFTGAIIFVCHLIFWLTHLASSSWEFSTGNVFLFPCPGCSTALLSLAVFHSRFSPLVVSPQGPIRIW